MGRLRGSLSVSLDGYGAGPGQSLETPLGRGGEDLHGWFIPTHTFKSYHGAEGGSRGVDDEVAAKIFEDIGAWIMGRNMFGPIRGGWGDEDWKGWWGDNPPYHVPVQVLTHHARAPIEMAGGTTFHFVTEGIEAALKRARAAAGDRNILIGGGVATIRQYLQAKLLDELHLAVSPILLGSGESLFQGLDLPALGYRVADRITGEGAMHVFIRREA